MFSDYKHLETSAEIAINSDKLASHECNSSKDVLDQREELNSQKQNTCCLATRRGGYKVLNMFKIS